MTSWHRRNHDYSSGGRCHSVLVCPSLSISVLCSYSISVRSDADVFYLSRLSKVRWLLCRGYDLIIISISWSVVVPWDLQFHNRDLWTECGKKGTQAFDVDFDPFAVIKILILNRESTFDIFPYGHWALSLVENHLALCLITLKGSASWWGIGYFMFFSRCWKYKRYNPGVWVVLITVCFRVDPLSSPFE